MEFSERNYFEIAAGREILLDLKFEKDSLLELSFEFEVQNRDLEWIITFEFAGKKYEEFISANKNKEIRVEIDAKKTKHANLYVKSPRASSTGDRAILKIKYDGFERRVEIRIRNVIVVVKTSIGQEYNVARDISAKAEMENLGIYSVFVPVNLKGYVFVETSNPDKILSLTKRIRGIKGVVRGEVSIDEIRHYLTPPPVTTKINIGDIVELVEGPFKGEKARIMQIYDNRDEIVVELLGTVVPIPITVKADMVRILEKKEEKSER